MGELVSWYMYVFGGNARKAALDIIRLFDEWAVEDYGYELDIGIPGHYMDREDIGYVFVDLGDFLHEKTHLGEVEWFLNKDDRLWRLRVTLIMHGARRLLIWGVPEYGERFYAVVVDIPSGRNVFEVVDDRLVAYVVSDAVLHSCDGEKQ